MINFFADVTFGYLLFRCYQFVSILSVVQQHVIMLMLVTKIAMYFTVSLVPSVTIAPVVTMFTLYTVFVRLPRLPTFLLCCSYANVPEVFCLLDI